YACCSHSSSCVPLPVSSFPSFFFNDPPPTEIYTLSLHDALPIFSGLAQIGLALPSFWLGIFLILLFAVRLNWLPAGGFPGWDAGWGPALQALLLPAAALGAARAASLTRIVRAAALDVLGRDFVRTARAKGVPEARVLSRHVLRNALITISTVIVLELGQLLAGAVIIEQVFSLPGL